MRAEDPKKRPTAVLSDQLSARRVHAMSKYGRPQKYALADTTLLRFDVCIIIYTLRALQCHSIFYPPTFLSGGIEYTIPPDI